MTTYEIYDKSTDRLLAVGTVQAIADKLGFRPQSVRQIITKCSKGEMQKYRVEFATPAYDMKKKIKWNEATKKAVSSWNYHIGYERKRRGITRWQPSN